MATASASTAMRHVISLRRLAGKIFLNSENYLERTKYALNNWLRVNGPLFDTSTALEILGFTGAEARGSPRKTEAGVPAGLSALSHATSDARPTRAPNCLGLTGRREPSPFDTNRSGCPTFALHLLHDILEIYRWDGYPA
jgi:hypothetical protein